MNPCRTRNERIQWDAYGTRKRDTLTTQSMLHFRNSGTCLFGNVIVDETNTTKH